MQTILVNNGKNTVIRDRDNLLYKKHIAKVLLAIKPIVFNYFTKNMVNDEYEKSLRFDFNADLNNKNNSALECTHIILDFLRNNKEALKISKIYTIDKDKGYGIYFKLDNGTFKSVLYIGKYFSEKGFYVDFY